VLMLGTWLAAHRFGWITKNTDLLTVDVLGYQIFIVSVSHTPKR
jgi:hypothetical protein